MQREQQTLNKVRIFGYGLGVAPNWVSIQIKDGSTTLTKGHPEFPASEVVNWSDEKLSQMIEVVTDGLVRKST